MNPVNRKINIIFLLSALPALFPGMNYRPLISAWTIWSATRRLTKLALHTSDEFQNPDPIEDRFEAGLSPQFWKFTPLNGAGQVSNEPAWHAAAMTFDHGLSLQHFPDPNFQNENTDRFQSPAAGRYNNVTLIGGGDFVPRPRKMWF
jgi:hypothetical protein